MGEARPVQDLTQPREPDLVAEAPPTSGASDAGVQMIVDAE